MTTQEALRFDDLARERPRLITTESHEEFMELCSRQDRGELEILSVIRGEGASWIVEVWYEPTKA